MKWTTEKPTQPGWYWLREMTYTPDVDEPSLEDPEIVELQANCFDDFIITSRSKWDLVSECLEGTLWAGPIALPEE